MPGTAEVEVNTKKRKKKSKTKNTADPDIGHQDLILQMTVCFPLHHHLLEARQIQVLKMLPREK